MYIPRPHAERKALIAYPKNTFKDNKVHHKKGDPIQDKDLREKEFAAARDDSNFTKLDQIIINELARMLRRPITLYRNLKNAQAVINAALGARHPFARRSPPLKRRHPETGNPLEGLEYTALQTLAIAWLLMQVETIGAGLIGDEPGLGKTLIFIMWLIISRNKWQRRHIDYRNDLPDLVVVPKTILDKTVQEVDELSGEDTPIYVLGQHKQPYLHYEKGCVELDRETAAPWVHDPANGKFAGRGIVVANIEHLQHMDPGSRREVPKPVSTGS